ncbi:autotransporter outer membrane beta-barrel domain-containing protein [Herminiimonas glaciei]|uniref:Autotransporter outer membrane beta-barrel domain-containing protein n=1 Tax=Herminiimonas glaciei TaxID=523788 RepID=A0ABW2I747_9BURK
MKAFSPNLYERSIGSSRRYSHALSAQSALALLLSLVAAPAMAQVYIENDEVVNVPGTHASPWNVGDILVVGSIGSGELNVNAGGIVNAGGLQIGGPASISKVTIGAGGQFNNNNLTVVGFSGEGELRIAAGGILRDSIGYIGFGITAPGRVHVTGAGSRWENDAGITLGYAGEGLLRIANGGVVSTPFLTISEFRNGKGTLAIGGAPGAAAEAAGTLDAPTIWLGPNGGQIVFNHLNDDYIFSPYVFGTGDVYQLAGTTILGAANDYFGHTTISGGTLAAGAANRFSANSDHTVTAGGTLDTRGFEQTLLSLDNGGTVNIASSGVSNVLTVSGNYSGNGGKIILNAVLGGDDSATDKLKIQGDTAGTTAVVINNIGGVGALTGTGIKIIDVAGASNGTFQLKGQYRINDLAAMVVGPYAYTLQQNGIGIPADGGWYLRSRYQAGVPTYESYPQTLLALSSLPSLQQRVGNRMWAEPDATGTTSRYGSDQAGTGMWAHIEGRRDRINPARSTSEASYNTDIYRIQGGIDGLLYADAGSGQLIAGLSAQYANGRSAVSSPAGNGRINTAGYGIGASLTWYGVNGFYADGQVQANFYNSDLSSPTAGISLAKGNDGRAYTASIEAGQRIQMTPGWTLTPQAQLSYSTVRFDDFTDGFGARVSLDQGSSLRARLGLSLDHEKVWRDGSGKQNRQHTYAIANLYNEFKDGTQVNVSDLNFVNRNTRLWGGLGLGASYSWANGKYMIYGQGSVNTSLNNFGDSYSLGATVGLRILF